MAIQIPAQVDNDPISVQERLIRQFDCPNPDCDAVLDITNVNVGTKLKCQTCNNVTWLPDYGRKWWQKPLSIITGLILSFIIGLLASLTANWIDLNSESPEGDPSAIEQEAPNNGLNPDASKAGAG